MLLAFDLDSTIVTEDYRLLDSTAEAIRRARAKGHLVTVITGRSLSSARPYLEQLGLVGHYGTNHGAFVADAMGGTLRQSELATSLVHEVLERYESRGVRCSVTIGERLYVRDPGCSSWHWTRAFSVALLRHTDYDGTPPEKLVLQCARSAPEIERDLRAQYPDLSYYLWDGYGLEITGKDGHKGAALELLAQTLGVPQAETVAFGDGLNDISMMQWAGYSVAVGAKAHPEVLAAANEHVAAPEEHGVADWLERNLL